MKTSKDFTIGLKKMSSSFITLMMIVFMVGYSSKSGAATYLVSSISVGNQVGTINSGTAGSATYTLTISSYNWFYGTNATNLSLNMTLPAGVSYTLNPANPVNISNSTTTVTLTIYTSCNTPAGSTAFTVSSPDGLLGTVYSNSKNFVVSSCIPITASISPSGPTTFCTGGNVTLTSSAGCSYLWNTGATIQSINVSTSGNYSVTVTSGTGCTASATQTVTVNANNPLSVSIAASPSGAICTGTNVTFTATPVNGGTSPTYQWKKNGVVVGTNSSTYTNAGLVNNDQIQCILTVGTGVTCSTGSPATSNTITETVNANNPLSVSIAASPSGAICSGTSVTFTATPVNGGTSPTYQWKKNGVVVGTNSATYTNAGLVNNDQILCILTVGTGVTCSTGSPAISNIITEAVNQLPTPIISASGPTTFCAGRSVTLTTTEGSSYLWNTGQTTQSITKSSSSTQGYETINYTVRMTDANGCSGTSLVTVVTINPNPKPNISGEANRCNSVDLDAGSGYNSYLWSNGITNEAVTINSFGAYNLTITVTDNNGCNGVATISGTVYQPPVVSCTTDIITISDLNICGASVNFAPSFSTGIPTPSIEYSHTSGTLFGVGLTTVTATATNTCGVSTCSFNITVVDNEPPVTIANSITINLDNSGNSNISVSDIDGGSYDNCGVETMTVFPNSFTCNEVGDNIVTLTVTDVYGNISSSTSMVTIQDNILPVVIYIPVTVALDNSGNASIQVSDIDGGSFDNCSIASMDISLNTFTCNDIGDNLVTLNVRDVNGNTSSSSTTVTVQDLIPQVVICMPVTVALDNSGNGSIQVSDIDGGSFDNCSIASMNISSNTFTCNDIGDNLVTLNVTDINGNSASASTTVTIVDQILPVTISQPVLVLLDENGNASIQVSDIDGGSFDNCSIATMVVNPSTFNCNNIGDNEVTLTVTDVNGNSSISTAIVTVLDKTAPVLICPSDITQLVDKTTCNAVVTFSISAAENCGTPTIVSDYSSGSIFNIGNTIVNCSASDAFGNISVCSFNITVLSNIPAQPVSINGSTLVCDGSSQTYSISPVDEAISYSWTLPIGWSGSSTTNEINSLVGLNGGIITVTANNACGNSIAQTLVTEVTSIPSQPGTINGNTFVCQGNSQFYSVNPVNDATSYTWTLPSGWVGSSTTNSINIIPENISGTISVIANNSCGSSTESSLFVNICTTLPAQPGLISGNTNICYGLTETYSVAAISGATSYIWTLPYGWTGTSNSESITVTVGNSNGTISVKAVNACGISSPSNLAVIHNHAPSQPGSMAGLTTVCPGSQQTYSVALVTDATSYIWTLPSGWTGNSTTNTILVTVGNAGGNISVKASNDCGAGSARVLFVTTTTVPNAPGVITGPTSVCQGSTQTYSIAAVSGATSYLWMLPTGWIGSSTTTNITLTVGATSGNVSVLSVNNCGNSNTTRVINVSVSVPLSQPAAISGNTIVCKNSSQTYSVTPVSGANSYTWTLPSGWSGTSSTNAITTIVGSASGNISVVANNVCGSSPSQSLNVVSNNVPSVPGAISGNTIVCRGSSQTYSVTPVEGALSYIWTMPSGWSGTSNTNSITCTVGTTNGNITVKASNACGNSSAQTLGVTVSQVTNVVITGNPSNYNFCSQISPTSVVLMASSGFGSYQWTPSGGNTQTTTVNIAGTYVVSATNAAGCISTASKTVTNNCALPTNLNTTNILGTSAKATWVQSQCAYNYTIQISVHNQNNWITRVIPQSAAYTFTGLALSTQYDWQIQTNCNTNGTINSGWSAIQTFTTAAQRIEEEMNTGISFMIYPNPAHSMVTLGFNALEEGSYNIKLVDMFGRIIKSDIDNASTGDNVYNMNLYGVAKGIYFVVLQKGNNSSTLKLVVE